MKNKVQIAVSRSLGYGDFQISEILMIEFF